MRAAILCYVEAEAIFRRQRTTVQSPVALVLNRAAILEFDQGCKSVGQSPRTQFLPADMGR